ncbi:hypothetical protein B7494_g1096 [Chlorociboria aeruginascens]|nr:hypothetical protein B7494_g1096 [Chlorociboria aeruginascens]
MAKLNPSDKATDASITDPRFSSFATDPRFRLPSRKHMRTTIDKRFSRMFKDDDFSNTAKVDRYGRKLSTGGKKKALEGLYVPDEEEAEVEIEDDEVVEKELLKADKKYDPARDGGFSSSEDESEEEEEEDGGVAIEESTFPDMQAESAGVERGEVSSRIAVVNLDWDNIRAVDLMAVFSSFVQAGGKIHQIAIYQSEFGKERMEREELEGPPKEIFAKKQESDSEVDSDVEDEKIRKDLQREDDGQEFDSAALRRYQLERLRYYYAVIICSDPQTAEHIYNVTDGTEYLTSANFFDLRFIPDGTEFDDKPRDECDAIPADYRPNEFVTDALQHSKVKLTWDMDPEEASRKNAIKRAFSGSRAEIGENDLRAYLGSDSSGSEPEPEVEQDINNPQPSKKELTRQKMRAALGLSDQPIPKSKDKAPVGDLEITFSAGLTSKDSKASIFENEPIIEETTAEKYIRKEKERKARRKAKAKAIREGIDPDTLDAKSDSEREGAKDQDLGFNDPFFSTSEATKSKSKSSKESRLARRAEKAAQVEATEAERANLSLLMTSNTNDAPELSHFDINEISRAEKAARKKGKKGKKVDQSEGGKRGGLQQGFEIDVGDERFGKLFENHEFAIDPSNPRFRGTEGMKKLLEEGRRKRGVDVDAGDERAERSSKKKRKHDANEITVETGEKSELSNLVEKVKKRSKR